MRKRVILGTAIGLLAVGFIYLSLVITPFGYRSVVWSVGGVSYEEREPGLSFVFPLIQRAYQLDVREQRYVTADPEGGANAFLQSSDLQEIKVKGSVVYSPDPTQAAELYDLVGPDYATRIIEPIFFDAIKEAGGQVAAEAFAGQLGTLAETVRGIITPQLAERGISVKSVLIEDAVFDEAFVQSVKEKVIADQEAAEQRKLVEAERAKAEQVLLQAEAQRQRAAELGLTPEQYLRLLWIEKWGGILPSTVLGSDTGVILGGVNPN